MGTDTLGRMRDKGKVWVPAVFTMIVSRGEPEKLVGSLASPEAVYDRGRVLTKT